MSSIRKEYEYKAKWSILVLGGGFFGLGTALFIYLAITNDEGLIISGINLSPFGARVFLLTIAGLSLLFVIGAAFAAYVRWTTTQRIAVTSNGILLPAGRWTSREHQVLFHSITALKKVTVGRQVSLHIYADGSQYTILKSMLPHESDFDDIVSPLAAEAPLQ